MTFWFSLYQEFTTKTLFFNFKYSGIKNGNETIFDGSYIRLQEAA